MDACTATCSEGRPMFACDSFPLLRYELRESVRNVRFLIFLVALIALVSFIAYLSQNMPPGTEIADSDVLLNVFSYPLILFLSAFFVTSSVSYEFQDRTFYFIRSKTLGGNRYLLVKMLALFILQSAAFAVFDLAVTGIALSAGVFPIQLGIELALNFPLILVFEAMAVLSAVVLKNPVKSVLAVIAILMTLGFVEGRIGSANIELGCLRYAMPTWLAEDASIRSSEEGSGFYLDVTGSDLMWNSISGIAFCILWGAAMSVIALHIYERADGRVESSCEGRRLPRGR